MRNINRRTFVQCAAVLAAGAITIPAFASTRKMPLLSFSTLGCPDWNFNDVVNFAQAHGYQGIELRGIQKELDLTKCKEFNSSQSIASTLELLKQKNLQLVDLGSSCNLHIADATERKKNLDEAKSFINLAQQTGCPYIRVFPNNLPKDQAKEQTIQIIAQGLLELGNYAANTQVTVLMETHGDLVHSDDIVSVMQKASTPHTGLVWDIANMWTITKEPPAIVYNKLKNYIRHTHVKDAKLLPDDKLGYVLLGQGDVPIFDAIDLLYNDGYKGYYSFEWEKLWHPEIAASDVALGDYPVAMRNHFALKQ